MSTKFTEFAAINERYSKAVQGINDLQEAAHAKYGSHSYSSGFLGSKLATIASQYLTKTQFQEFLAAMKESADDQVEKIA